MLSVVGGGVGTILVVLAVAFFWPEVRRFGSLAEARPIEQDDEEERPNYPAETGP